MDYSCTEKVIETKDLPKNIANSLTKIYETIWWKYTNTKEIVMNCNWLQVVLPSPGDSTKNLENNFNRESLLSQLIISLMRRSTSK